MIGMVVTTIVELPESSTCFVNISTGQMAALGHKDHTFRYFQFRTRQIYSKTISGQFKYKIV